MSLDIGIGNGISLIPVSGEPSFRLEGGIYWFLHPLLERLATETGQYIDLYGDASFTDAALVELKRMLAEARDLAAAQPHSWLWFVGLQTAPVRKELFKTVERAEVFATLDCWDKVVRRAEELGQPVVCFGD